MAMKPENKFINSLNDKIPIKKRARSAKARLAHRGAGIHYEKMNNPYLAGTADSWYSGNKADLWIEFKWLPKTPIRATVDPTKLLSALQVEWLNDRCAEGRNVYVVIGCPDGCVLLENFAWKEVYAANAFRSLLRSKETLAHWIIEKTTTSLS